MGFKKEGGEGKWKKRDLKW
jgi:hypothetical protein